MAPFSALRHPWEQLIEPLTHPRPLPCKPLPKTGRGHRFNKEATRPMPSSFPCHRNGTANARVSRRTVPLAGTGRRYRLICMILSLGFALSISLDGKPHCLTLREWIQSRTRRTYPIYPQWYPQKSSALRAPPRPSQDDKTSQPIDFTKLVVSEEVYGSARKFRFWCFGSPQGFEPRLSESESLVLPLNEGAICRDGATASRKRCVCRCLLECTVCVVWGQRGGGFVEDFQEDRIGS